MIKINCLFLTFFVFNANLFPIVGYYMQEALSLQSQDKRVENLS